MGKILRGGFIVSSVVFAVSVWLFGGTGGCGGGATRGFTGTINSSSLAGLTVRSRQTDGSTLVLKNQTLTCTDIQVVAAGPDGGDLVAEVSAECTFTLNLPLNNFCWIGLFRESDDGYISSLGCAENGYEGAVPIFPGADDSEEAIDIGGVTLEGDRGVSTENPCTLVDQDGDGTADAADDDDDGDGTGDANDPLDGSVCTDGDNFDSDDNDIPDCFEDLWGDLDDQDEDEVPDFCDGEDEETGCSDPADADGDCIPDEFDECLEDSDGDGVPDCLDCDSSSTDLAASLDCYDDFCTVDSDGDGFSLCDDCDDEDSSTTDDCEEFDDFDPCAVDGDSDGINLCDDCDDEDSAVGLECTQCSTSSCDGAFDCQLFAEDDLTDEFETDNTQCVAGCCELVE